jgi:DNA-binding IclR family transcriptional regulator
MKNDTETSAAGSLRRGLHILNALRSGGEMNVGRLSQATGIPRPTIYRVLDVLEAEHYVRRLSGSYFAATLPEERVDERRDAWVSYFAPRMRRIASRTGNSVFLGAIVGDDLLVLHREIGPYPIQILALPIGGRQPLGVGAGGVALLSDMPTKQLAAVLRRNAELYKNFGSLNATLVRRLIENCQARGYSVVGNYALKGVLGLGLLCSGPELQKCAVSVTAPIDRMTASAQRDAIKIMREELHNDKSVDH